MMHNLLECLGIVAIIVFCLFLIYLFFDSWEKGQTYREWEWKVLMPLSPDEWKALTPEQQEQRFRDLKLVKKLRKK